MAADGTNSPPLGDEQHVVGAQELDEPGNAVAAGDEPETASRLIPLMYPVQEVGAFLLGVDGGVLGEVQLGRIRPVDLQNSPYRSTLVSPDHVELRSSLVELEFLEVDLGLIL